MSDNDFPRTPKNKSKVSKKNRVSGAEIADLISGYPRKRAAEDVIVDTLGFDSICEGILSLGRVAEVRNREIMVSLPGRTLGSVPITSISTSYTSVLEKLAAGTLASDQVVYQVSEMYEKGQVVIVKVMSVEKVGLKTCVTLSMKPEDLHSNYNALLFSDKMVYTASVESHEDHGYVMSFGVKGIRAFLPENGAKTFIKNRNNNKPLGIGQVIQCKITHFTTHRFIANATLTANPREVATQLTPEGLVNYSTLLPGMLGETMVLNTHKTGLKVYFLELGGLIHQDHLHDVWDNPLNYELSSKVTTRVLYIMPNGTRPYLSLHPKLVPGLVTARLPVVNLGQIYNVNIVRYEKRGLIIKFQSGEKGIVTIQRCSDDLTYTEENILRDFPNGSLHNCRVLEYNSLDNIYIGTFQASFLGDITFRIEQLKVGQVVTCQIKSWNKGGAIVSIDRVAGFIPVAHFELVPLKDPRIRYVPGTNLKGRIFKIDVSSNKVLLTARKRLVKSKRSLICTYEDAVVGDISDGTIYNVKRAGIIVTTMGGLMGYVPRSKITLEPDQTLMDAYTPGQLVKFRVHEVQPDRKVLILLLEFEEFMECNDSGLTEEENERKNNESIIRLKNVKKRLKSYNEEVEKKKRKLEGENEDLNNKYRNEISPLKKKIRIENGEKDEVDVQPDKESRKRKKKRSSEDKELKPINGNNYQDVTILKPEKKKKSKKDKTIPKSNESGVVESVTNVKPLCLGLPTKSFWDISMDESTAGVNSDSGSGSDNESESTKAAAPKKKLDKRAKAKARELEIRQKELALADPTRKPESVDEFDCLVMGSPNSSLCWIQYMSFYLESANIDMARVVGQRALKAIVFNEEQERMNIWVALLNLENSYGTEESLKELFREALQSCDDYMIFLKLADIYGASKKFEEAEKVLITLIKKYKTNLEVWIRLGHLYYRNDKVELGRRQFHRALISLHRRDHIPLITKYAKLEFRFGDSGRGKTMMDQVLANFPSRLDLWISYAQILIKHKHYNDARQMFEKAIDNKFSPKKMRILLRAYLEFENTHGDAETRAHVGQRAVEYAENIELKVDV